MDLGKVVIPPPMDIRKRPPFQINVLVGAKTNETINNVLLLLVCLSIKKEIGEHFVRLLNLRM